MYKLEVIEMRNVCIWLVAMLATFSACDSTQREYDQLMGEYDRIKAGVEQQQQQYVQMRADYDELRAQYDGQDNKIGEDSLHTTIREQHDILLEAHAAYQKRAEEILQLNQDIFKRHEVEDYPIENVRADFKELNANMVKLNDYYNNITNEIIHMLDEQQGMLQDL